LSCFPCSKSLGLDDISRESLSLAHIPGKYNKITLDPLNVMFSNLLSRNGSDFLYQVIPNRLTQDLCCILLSALKPGTYKFQLKSKTFTDKQLHWHGVLTELKELRVNGVICMWTTPPSITERRHIIARTSVWGA